MGKGLPKRREEVEMFWEKAGASKREHFARGESGRADCAGARSSEEEHMENALALGAEEGRDKLRKAMGSCK